MGIIMQSRDRSPSEQQNLFWGSEEQSVSPPQMQMVDNVAQQQSTQVSGTENNPAQYGSSSIALVYDTPEKKSATSMNWGQFVKGFFTPIVIMLFLSIFLDSSDIEGIMTDSFLLLMLLIAILKIVISFARGNKSYGYGMLISVSIPVLWAVMIYGFLIILLLGFV
ncbi:MAG: hypothetical protein QMC43_04225 [Candidatus Poseidoniaceae archaeon]|jgi:hypothetical protein|tara:strand:- start:303 stop:800 length:498 start_codon:yes stop_codon:yes gene_type:complete